ncbi:UBN2_3 domain-containing protein [Cucumis melo var. makuwa]|uniref:UBN2_3 domain-containing protein n=1 Tax=Cucumis melo var. makuwa TaxID=1194695 RepID=A0A5D3DI75_CUCMM|nr:UBN2_3 domain-containing protein [Cucumis melo var. makuwa]
MDAENILHVQLSRRQFDDEMICDLDKKCLFAGLGGAKQSLPPTLCGNVRMRWNNQDHWAWIIDHESPQKLKLVVWKTLETHYSSNTKTNIVNLKSDLQQISKKQDESIDLYIKKIKELKDKLANAATIVEDEDPVIYALNGLPSEYSAFRTSMQTRSQPVGFSDLHVLLKSEESAIEKQTKCEDILGQPTTMLAN